MTLPKRPPLRQDWELANWEKRTDRCRICGTRTRKIELAHVIGVEHDTREAVVTTVAGKEVRLVTINPDRVFSMCGPVTDSGTCHWLDHHYRLEKWDHMTDAEKRQAIVDAGGLGQALRRCAPLSWLDRVEVVDGQQVEIPAVAGREAVTK